MSKPMTDRVRQRERPKREHIAAHAAETRRKRAAVGLPPGGGARLNVQIDGRWREIPRTAFTPDAIATTAESIDQIIRHTRLQLLPWQLVALRNLLDLDLSRSTRHQ